MRRTCTANELVASMAQDGLVAGLVITDPAWDLAGGGRFEAVADYQRQSVAEAEE